MGWYTSSRTAAFTTSKKGRAVRRLAAATTAGLVLTLVQAPAEAATDGTAAEQILDPGVGTPALVSPEQQEIDAAAAEAKETDKRVEIKSARKTDSTTYVEPSGRTTVELTEIPTRVEQHGELVDIDPSLSKKDGVLITEATESRVEVSDGLGSEPLAKVSNGSKSLALDWPTDLPKASIAGDAATFDAGSTKDVRVTARNDGFSVHILLDKAPTSAPIYRLPITATGMRLTETDSSGFVAEDAKGEADFWIDPPVAWEHSQANLEAGPEVTVRSLSQSTPRSSTTVTDRCSSCGRRWNGCPIRPEYTQ